MAAQRRATSSGPGSPLAPALDDPARERQSVGGGAQRQDFGFAPREPFEGDEALAGQLIKAGDHCGSHYLGDHDRPHAQGRMTAGEPIERE